MEKISEKFPFPTIIENALKRLNQENAIQECEEDNEFLELIQKLNESK
jgi:hypothetical protein